MEWLRSLRKRPAMISFAHCVILPIVISWVVWLMELSVFNIYSNYSFNLWQLDLENLLMEKTCDLEQEEIRVNEDNQNLPSSRYLEYPVTILRKTLSLPMKMVHWSCGMFLVRINPWYMTWGKEWMNKWMICRKGYSPATAIHAITAVSYSPNGQYLVYAKGYNWSLGYPAMIDSKYKFEYKNELIVRLHSVSKK